LRKVRQVRTRRRVQPDKFLDSISNVFDLKIKAKISKLHFKQQTGALKIDGNAESSADFVWGKVESLQEIVQVCAG
jgi:hypothetical protein